MPDNPFAFDQDHLDYQRTVRDLARSEFLDGNLEGAARTEFPRRELKALAESGLTDLTLPLEDGWPGDGTPQIQKIIIARRRHRPRGDDLMVSHRREGTSDESVARERRTDRGGLPLR